MPQNSQLFAVFFISFIQNTVWSCIFPSWMFWDVTLSAEKGKLGTDFPCPTGARVEQIIWGLENIFTERKLSSLVYLFIYLFQLGIERNLNLGSCEFTFKKIKFWLVEMRVNDSWGKIIHKVFFSFLSVSVNPTDKRRKSMRLELVKHCCVRRSGESILTGSLWAETWLSSKMKSSSPVEFLGSVVLNKVIS